MFVNDTRSTCFGLIGGVLDVMVASKILSCFSARFTSTICAFLRLEPSAKSEIETELHD